MKEKEILECTRCGKHKPIRQKKKQLCHSCATTIAKEKNEVTKDCITCGKSRKIDTNGMCTTCYKSSLQYHSKCSICATETTIVNRKTNSCSPCYNKLLEFFPTVNTLFNPTVKEIFHPTVNEWVTSTEHEKVAKDFNNIIKNPISNLSIRERQNKLFAVLVNAYGDETLDKINKDYSINPDKWNEYLDLISRFQNNRKLKTDSKLLMFKRLIKQTIKYIHTTNFPIAHLPVVNTYNLCI